MALKAEIFTIPYDTAIWPLSQLLNTAAVG